MVLADSAKVSLVCESHQYNQHSPTEIKKLHGLYSILSLSSLCDLLKFKNQIVHLFIPERRGGILVFAKSGAGVGKVGVYIHM